MAWYWTVWLLIVNSKPFICLFLGTFGKVYCGTLLSEEDSEVADQEIFVKTITGELSILFLKSFQSHDILRQTLNKQRVVV